MQKLHSFHFVTKKLTLVNEKTTFIKIDLQKCCFGATLVEQNRNAMKTSLTYAMDILKIEISELKTRMNNEIDVNYKTRYQVAIDSMNRAIEILEKYGLQ